MRQYVIDELRPTDFERIKAYFNENLETGHVDGIYWLPLEADLLTQAQSAHTDCHPLCFAIDLEQDRIACELLLRSQNRIRCSCMDYATEEQRNWLIRFADTLLEQLDIKT